MAVDKYFCFDLRTGIMAVGVFHMISLCFASVVHFVLSLDDEEPEAAANQTFYFAGDLVGLILYGCLTYGAYKESRVFLMPYLITIAVLLVITTLAMFVLLFFAPLLIFLFVIIGFYWYTWYAILCYYQSLDPRNPNYVPQQLPSTIVYVEGEKPPVYYENNVADV